MLCCVITEVELIPDQKNTLTDKESPSKNGGATQEDPGDGKERVPSSIEVLPPEWDEDPLHDEPSWESFLHTKVKVHKYTDPHDMMLGDQPMKLVDDSDSQDGFKIDVEKQKKDRNRSKERQSSREHKGRRRKGRKHKGRNKNRQSSTENQSDADTAPRSPTTWPVLSPSTWDLDHDRNEEMHNMIYENTQAPIKFYNCDELRCHAGGRCVPDEMRGGVRCQCHLGNSGDFCERGKSCI